jgi:pSer/pThr/pTyr-binding forkhead associated (FHA) protein
VSLFDAIAKWLGLSDPAPPLAPDAAATAATAAAMPAGASSMTTGAVDAAGSYSGLWLSLERHLAQFMARSVLPHRQVEPDDVFRLVRIQVAGTDAAAQGAIDAFLAEFRPESRRKAVIAAVRRYCAAAVDCAGFVDLHRDFDVAELDEADPYDAQLAPAHQGGFRFTLFGEWTLQPATAGAYTAEAQAIDVEVRDARGQHRLQIDALPWSIGRSAAATQHPVAGRFVSRSHGVLERDGRGTLWWHDTSVNGSAVDGEAVAPGARCALRSGSRLRLGGTDGDVADCPELTLRWAAAAAQDDAPTPLRTALRDEATPLRTGSNTINAATPLTAAPLALLGVKDAQGSRTVPVLRLPWTIGRGDAADCRLPEDNAGVSREHLVIERLDGAGAHCRHPAAAKWGTQVDGAEQGIDFVLPWGRQATLAPRYTDAPAATVLLLPPSP